MSKPRSKSSKRWLKEHHSDEYVLRARKEGWRSRAVFKLEELDQKYRLLRPGMRVLDLGAAPGGWSQYAARALGDRGQVLAVDLLEMDPLPGVDMLVGDFREQVVLDQILQKLGEMPVDLVLSDMAPNISGVEAVDIPRAMYLAELAVDLARQVLRPGGDLVMKVFQGEGSEALLQQLKTAYDKVIVRKPRASRGRSREVYVVARNRKMV